MTNEEKADLLRKELRNGRIGRSDNQSGFPEAGQSGASSNTSGNDRGYYHNRFASVGTGDKTSGQKTGRGSGGTRTSDQREGVNDNPQRSVEEILKRQRQSNRRSIISDSSFREVETSIGGSDGTVGTATVEGREDASRLQRTDAIPQREFDREEKPIPQQPIPKRPGRPKNQAAVATGSVSDTVSNQFRPIRLEQLPQEPKKPLFEKGKPIFPWFKGESLLTKRETDELREPLEEAIKDYSKYADQYIQYKTKSVEKIWSNLDDDEVKFLANVLLKRGQVNSIAASTVRNIVSGNEYLALAMMLGPRGIETYQVLNKTRKDNDALNPQRQQLRSVRRGPFRSQRESDATV